MQDRRREALRQDLNEMASGLELDQLKALSQGIGLGPLRAAIAPSAAAATPPRQQALPGERQGNRPRVETVIQQSYRPQTFQVQAPKTQAFKRGTARVPLRLWQGLAAHAIDLGVVALSLATMAVAAIMAISGEISLAPLMRSQTLVPQMLTPQVLSALLASLYAIFLAYWLVFKMVVGMTLGRIVIRLLGNVGAEANSLEDKAN